MGQVRVVSEWSNDRPLSAGDGRRYDRFGRRTISEPLFEQQHGGGTVKAATAIAMQAEAFSGGPAAAVLIHPSQRQIQASGSQGPSQPQPVAPAMQRLAGRLLGVVQGQANHQGLHPSLLHQGLEMAQIPFKRAPQQGGQGGDRQAEGVTTGQADAPLTHIQSQR
jgi:hypothetical protein